MNPIEIQKEYLIPTYPNRGLNFVKGEGVYLYEESGEKYLDCVSGMGINVLGHAHPKILTALKNQIDNLISLHCSFNSHVRSQALVKLKEVLPENLNRFYFSSTGTEAVESALKFAVVYTGRHKFLAAHNGYHGKTLGALGATTSSDNKYREPFLKLIPSFDFVEYGNVASLENLISEEHAAIILEVVQGEGGIVPAPIGYLEKVKEICRSKGVLFIIDEIQTGMGRTGALFAFEQHKVVPDILCLAKGLGGGVPTGLTVVSPEISAKIPRGTQTSTFGGNPLSCAGIIATLEIIKEENLLAQAKENGRYFLEKLQTLTSPLIKEARGVGLMIGLELNQPSIKYVQALQKEGVLTIPTGEKVIRFLPPLIITKEEIDLVIEKIVKVLV